METMKDKRFLNRLDFVEKINRDLIEGMRCIKLQIVNEFGEYNKSTMICALDVIDERIAEIKFNEINAF